MAGVNTNHWKDKSGFSDSTYGSRDFFCLHCNCVATLQICCDDAEAEERRLSNPSEIAYWSEEY